VGTSTTAKALTVRLRFRVSRVAPRQRGLGNVAGSSRARSNSATPVTRSAHLLGCKRVQWAHAGVEPRCADRAHPLPLDRRRSAALSRGRTAGLSAALPSHIVSAGKTAAYSRSGCNWCDTMTWPIDAATRRPCDAGQSTGTRPSEELGAAPAVQGTALPVRRGARRIHAGQCDGGTACMGQRHPPRPRRLWLGYARNVERLTRDTFGPTGSFAVSLRSQWFATGDLLHMTLLGGSMRQRASGCGDDFGGG